MSCTGITCTYNSTFYISTFLHGRTHPAGQSRNTQILGPAPSVTHPTPTRDASRPATAGVVVPRRRTLIDAGPRNDTSNDGPRSNRGDVVERAFGPCSLRRRCTPYYGRTYDHRLEGVFPVLQTLPPLPSTKPTPCVPTPIGSGPVRSVPHHKPSTARRGHSTIRTRGDPHKKNSTGPLPNSPPVHP